MTLPDSFYLALCMTILLLGAVYWVWTQIQYVQRKVNALENIVYELKTLCSTRSEPVAPLVPVSYPPAPPSEIGEEDADLLEETLRKEVDAEPEHDDIETFAGMQDNGIEGLPEHETREFEETTHPLMQSQQIPQDLDDLQPGGSANSVVAPSFSSSLDSMSVKELRRLATQKGVSGAAEMKKKDLITAIRSIPMESFLE